MSEKRKRKQTKVPGGLTEVLFVRVGQELLEQLDRELDRERRRRPGYSRADLVRALLARGLGELES